MLNNLRAEMARNRIYNKDLAQVINKSRKSISNKITGKTDFTREEMLIIKETFFPDCTLDYLFDSAV